MSKTTWKIPKEHWEKSPRKFSNGSTDKCTDRAVGAYYGSSLELSISVSAQIANAGQVLCPASSALRTRIKPKHAYGEFGAIKEEVVNSSLSVEGGHQIMELASIDEVKAVSDCTDRLLNGDFVQSARLSYRTATGRSISYDQLVMERQNHVGENALIQAGKSKYLADRGLLAQTVNGRRVSPAYDDAALDFLRTENRKLWSATGVNLLIRISGKHTIAKDGNFVTGSLNQSQLDELASKLNYKETATFFKGSIRSRVLSVPVQSEDHVARILEKISEGISLKEFPDAVNKSLIKLCRVVK